MCRTMFSMAGDGRVEACRQRRRAKRGMVRAALLASTALWMMGTLPVPAQDATWRASPGSGDFNTGANWSTGTVPTGTAFFGTSNTTNISLDSDTTIGGFTFNAGTDAFVFSNNKIWAFNGAGIVINGGSATINNNNLLLFALSSTAGNATIINDSVLSFANSSMAGNASITNNDFLGFSDTSTADNATIVNNSRLRFFDTSTGGTARFINGVAGTIDLSGLTNTGITAGSIEGAGTIELDTKNLAVGGNNLSTTFSGVLQGTGGSLTKTGTGILNLTGTSTYDGATAVDGGTLLVNGSIASSSGLTVNPGATVGGTGTLPSTAINGGTLSPGNSIGTITVAGNLLLNAAATYLVEIAGANADRTNVTGTATLNGTVQVSLLPGSALSKRRYTILSAAGRLGGTEFAGVSMTNFLAGLSDDGNNVFLDLTTAALGLGSVLPRNPQSVANVINSFFNNGGTLPANFVDLFRLTGGNLANALTQLSGEVATSTQSAAFRSMDLFLQMMLDPFVAGRSSYAGGPALAFSGEGPPRSALASKFPIKEPPPTFAERWTAWGGAYGGHENRDGDTGIGSHALRTNVWGLAAGADWRMQDSVLGAALSAGTTSFDLSDGLGSGDTEYMQAGLYGSTLIGAAYASAALAYGWHQAEHERTIALTGPDTLKGDFAAHLLGGRIEAGWRQATPWLSLTPYAALTAQQFHSPGYVETASAGSADFALDYAGRTAVSVRSEIGAWLDQVYTYGYGGVLKLRGRAAWMHDYSDDPVMDAAFPVLPGTGFSVTGATAARDALLASAASELTLADGLSFIARFDGEFARTAQAYSGTATLRHVW